MITGSGIQTDPYIVHNWQEYMSVVKTDRYVKWADSDSKVIDFNDIQPDGYKDQSWIIFPYSTDFNGWTLKNLRINSGGIVPQNIRNLNLLDFELPSSEYGFSNAVISKYGTMENCIISGNINSENSVYFLDNVDAINCAFNVKITANGSFQLTRRDYSSFMQFRNCDTALDITANEAKLLFSGFSGQCYFKGNFDIKSDAPIIIGTERGNVFDFYSNAEIQYTGNGICIYNSEKLTKTSTSSDNMKPCTEEQLKNAEYLYSIGFPARTGKETEFTLEQGDIFTGFATDNQRTVRTTDYIPVSTAYEALTISAVYTKQKSLKPTVKAIGYSSTEISSRTAVSQNTSSVTVNYSALGNSDRIKVNFFRATVYLSQVYQLLPEDIEITITGNNYQWYIDKNGCLHADDMPYAPARKIFVPAVPQNEYIIIYDKSTPQDGFSNNGLAVLEPVSCTITENFNASWTVTLEHSVDSSQKWKYIKEFNILKVLGQLFVIKKTEHSWSGNSGKVVAYAEHIFYYLNDLWIKKGAVIAGYDGQRLIQNALSHAFTENFEGGTGYHFSSNSDITSESSGIEMSTLAYAKWQPTQNAMTPIEFLLGNDGFTANFGGDLYRNNFYFSINEKMENAVYNSFDIHVGLNLCGIRRTVDTSSLCTHFTAYDKFGSGVSVRWSAHGGVPHHIVRSQEFSFGENYTESNMDLIGYEAKKYFGLHKEPQIDITVDLEDVKNNPEYIEFANNPRYRVGDRGRIYDERLGISFDAHITHTVKDGITGKNLEITFSSISGFTNMGDYDISVDEIPATPENPDIPEEISDYRTVET